MSSYETMLQWIDGLMSGRAPVPDGYRAVGPVITERSKAGSFSPQNTGSGLIIQPATGAAGNMASQPLPFRTRAMLDMLRG